jgi:GT2 family glycosyltransferase
MKNEHTNTCDVLVSIVNYRTAERTINCVQSLLHHTQENHRIRIVITDNQSEENDGTVLRAFVNMQEYAPYCTLYEHDHNAGFAGGHHAGIESMMHIGFQPRYLWILNSDTTMLNDCIDELVRYMDAHESVGLASPQLYNDDGTPHQTAEYFPTLMYKIFGRGMVRVQGILRGKHIPPLADEYTVPTHVQVVSGAAMFLRTAAYHTIHGLDTRYFLYCEEEDCALSLHTAGYSVVVVPSAKICHTGSASTDTRALSIRKEYYISLFLLYRKWFPSWHEIVLRRFLSAKIARKYRTDAVAPMIAEFVRNGANPTESLRYSSKAKPPSLLHTDKKTPHDSL